MSRIENFSTFITSYQQACERGELNNASEETTRTWINQMLDIFGWDVRNTNYVLQEVSLDVSERAALSEIGSTNTRPDYTLMNGRVRLFFLDAKKRSVNIQVDNEVAFQIRSYGWSIGANYSIVTNMDELAIYECTAMPRHTDNAEFARVIYLKVQDYIDNFEALNSFLGREEAINRRQSVRFVGRDSIDKNFSKALSSVRLKLAQAIKDGNRGINSLADLNLWTQIILNRILFIRVCEARGLESVGLLKSYASTDFWREFKQSSYLTFYEHYDGPMFSRINQIHELNIDNDVFDELLSYLYYPSPYCFDVIPLKSISDIYDLFLGYHLEYDDSGTLTNALKSEFQRSNGAVTTPEHLVQNTINCTITPEYLQSLSNDEILNLRILDPACGSGVFLVSIYDHLVSQVETNIEDGTSSLPEQYIYSKDGRLCLNLEGRKLIVNNCLYGVDINQECVEVAKLSLSLRIIDGYDPCDFNSAGLYSAQILHGVGMNIKCGNSLVESDILTRVPEIRDNIEEFSATNIFNYRDAFNNIFSNGGFDFVIGNPPYVEVRNYNAALPCMANYIKDRYSSSRNGKIDLAIPFIERGIELLNDHGSLGYIVQKRFFRTAYGKGIRRLLSDQRLLRLVYNYNETDLFEDRITYVAVVVCDKSRTEEASITYISSDDGERIEIDKNTISETPWLFENHQTNALRVRLANELGALKDVCNIKVGVQVLWDRAYHIRVNRVDENFIYGSTAICENLQVEREACRVLLCNEHFEPLSIRPATTYILFPYDVENGSVNRIEFSDFESRYPYAGGYLRENRDLIEANVQTLPDRNITLDRDETWHLFTRENNHNATYSKLCIPMTTQNPQASVVMSDSVYCDNANMSFVQIPDMTDDKLYAMAAIINSTPFAYFAKSIANPQQGGFYKFNKQFLDPVPFPCEEFVAFSENMQRLAVKARQIEETNIAITTNTSHASRLHLLLSSLWNDVDNLCCELYGFSDEERNDVMLNARTDHRYE